MCMEQYDRMFRCYREPCTAVDILHYKPIVYGNEGMSRREHILVMCNNQANLCDNYFFHYSINDKT